MLNKPIPLLSQGLVSLHISLSLVLSLSSMGILLGLIVTLEELVILILNYFCYTYYVASASSIDPNSYTMRGCILSHKGA